MGRRIVVILDKQLFRNSIITMYPSYVKKAILKQAVTDGLVIDDKRKDGQMSLNLNNSIDVSDDLTIDAKFEKITESDAVLASIEDYEYRKPYRQFCYFEYSNFLSEKVAQLVDGSKLMVFDKTKQKMVDSFDIPTVRTIGKSIIFKFSHKLQDDSGHVIKYVILAIIDTDTGILEIRFDKVGIAYKNSYTYYKDKISAILKFFIDKLELTFTSIDFKAVVDYIKSKKDDITIFAQRMNRNGSTAYLEAYDGDDITIPILGELDSFITNNEVLFASNDQTEYIKCKLQEFLKEIEVKSDVPMVKVRMDESGIRFGITHNYKDTEYSMFMLYGELVGEEMMGSVKEYLMQCYKELRAVVSTDSIPTGEV